MAISANQIGTNNTLEQFRVQFNNLQSDVQGLESGTLNFESIAATSGSFGSLTVTGTFAVATFAINGNTLTFEGATADAFETSIFATDPTADRTITIPDLSGTLQLQGQNILIGDDGTIGSASDTNAIAISAAGVVTLSSTTDSTSSTTGALKVHSIGVVDDMFIGDNLTIIGDLNVGGAITGALNDAVLLNGTDGNSANAGDGIVQDTAANENDSIVYEDSTGDIFKYNFLPELNIELQSRSRVDLSNGEESSFLLNELYDGAILFEEATDETLLVGAVNNFNIQGEASLDSTLSVKGATTFTSTEKFPVRKSDGISSIILDGHNGSKLTLNTAADSDDDIIIEDGNGPSGVLLLEDNVVETGDRLSTNSDVLLLEDSVFLHSGVIQQTLNIFSSKGVLLKGLIGFDSAGI